mgnify:CR=1 FL=1
MNRLDLKNAIIKADTLRIANGIPVVNSKRNLARLLLTTYPERSYNFEEVTDWLNKAYHIGYLVDERISDHHVGQIIQDVCELLKCTEEQLIKSVSEDE